MPKIYKQGMDDSIKAKDNTKAMPHPYIFFTLQFNRQYNALKDVGMGHCLYVVLCFNAIIPTLFAYFLACHPYTFLHF